MDLEGLKTPRNVTSAWSGPGLLCNVMILLCWALSLIQTAMHFFKILTCPHRFMAHNCVSLNPSFAFAKTRNFTDFSTNLAIQHQLARFSPLNHCKCISRTTVMKWEYSIQHDESCFVESWDSISNTWVHIAISCHNLRYSLWWIETLIQKLIGAMLQLLGLAHDPCDSALNGLSTTLSNPEFNVFVSSTHPASKVDYPKVQFWERCTWDMHMKNKKDTTSINQSTPQRGGTQKSQNINVTMQYAEDADGVPVDGDRAMRQHARAIWDHFFHERHSRQDMDQNRLAEPAILLHWHVPAISQTASMRLELEGWQDFHEHVLIMVF